MRNIFVTLFLILSFNFSITSQEKLKIVASASMLQDIASRVIGSDHDISMIVPIGGDPHLHEPTPSNARLVADADLILINGLTFEGWINELIDNSGTGGTVVTVTQGIDVLGSQVYQNSTDPHAWMDASNGIIYARNIRDAIVELSPANASKYNANFTKYEKELRKLDEEITSAISTIPEKRRILITSHDAFQYYGRRYGIRLEAIMGISTEAEAQTADIIRVNKVIRENKVPAVFIESTINPKMIQQLATDNNVKIGGSLYADSLGDKDSPAATYIEMLRYNTKTIVTALSGASIENHGQTHDSNPSGTNWKMLGLIFGLLLTITAIVVIKLNR
ncbi:MAG: ABC-type Zn uptake system ZnuABC Zn-binding protein ZnuA [Saprospiraceae bacterium]|jgi:ABC-type Zn uptake system ZnuABC Zn-binding protein ZnuA